jgi:hypothetical protein
MHCRYRQGVTVQRGRKNGRFNAARAHFASDAQTSVVALQMAAYVHGRRPWRYE